MCTVKRKVPIMKSSLRRPRRGVSSIFAPLVLVCGAVVFPAWPGHAARARSHELTKDGLPNIKSAAALVVDLGNESVLYERDADSVRPIASISKIVAALVIHEECKLDPVGFHEMTVTNREAAKGGDKSKLTTGWRYSHTDLMHAALMRSDNRALPALGEACGMDVAQFGERMTARVRKMGLTKSFFREPTGLSSENVSTARELVKIVREVTRIQALTDIMSKREYTLTAYNKDGKSRAIKIKNTDRLLSKNIATIIGGKTGYTDIARYCFAVAARTLEGRDVAMIFLGAEGRYTRFADFTRVIKWLEPVSNLAKEDRGGKSQRDLSAKETVKAAKVRDAGTVALPQDQAPPSATSVPGITAPDASVPGTKTESVTPTGEAGTNGAALQEKIDSLTW